MKRQSGFTLIELLVTFAVLSALAGIAIPAFAVWLPNYRLKAAALDVFSSFQQAKMMAVRANADHSLVFDTGNNRYSLRDGAAATIKTVDLGQYGKPGDITFGWGDATINATDGGGGLPAGPVTFGANNASFNPRGMGNAGYLYLQNKKNSAYAVGKESTGLIKMKKWVGGEWK